MSAQWIQVGVFDRGALRGALARGGINFTETKSLTTSVFVIHESPAVYRALVLNIRKALGQ